MAHGAFQFFYVEPPRRLDDEGVPAAPWIPDAAKPVSWRLMAGNNHELGRSMTTFTDGTAASQAVRRLREGLPSALPRLSSAEEDGTWRWRLLLPDGELAAQSPRGYQRKVECRLAVGQFLVVASTAEVPAVVRTLRRVRWPQEPAT